MTFERPALNLHAVLCVITIILGVLVFANVIHVAPHQGVGLILTVLGILLLL